MREQKDRYEIFLKVCETGSFSKAAEALNYTQSGISQMMAGLEEELGVQLFARINRGVTLTDNGTRLLPYIRELANQKTRLRQAAFNINHKVEGKLRVGSFSSITTLWMPEVVHYFKENYPKVKIEILDGNYDEIREWIIRGQVDCGFLSSIVADDLKFYPLRDDPLCAVFPEGHPLAVRPSVTLPQLFQYPLIIETPGCDNDIQHLMLKCLVKPNISYSFRDDTLIMAFVRSGLGVTISQELVMQVSGLQREPADISNVVMAIKCGASDTISGMASNCVIGYVADKLVDLGATVVFGETTEFLGGEHILARRAVGGPDGPAGKKIFEIVNNMEQRAALLGEDMRGGQPTPGNIAGGLSSIEEKSLGAIVKSGHRPIQGVLEYPQFVTDQKGLWIKGTPGREPEILTAMAATGAQFMMFSTGRGAPQGFPSMPVIKICDNPNTYEHLRHDMDLNAGRIITGEASIEEVGEEAYAKMLRVLSGEMTKNEAIGYFSAIDIHCLGPVI